MIRRLADRLMYYWHEYWKLGAVVIFAAYLLLLFAGAIEWSPADPGNWNDADRAVP